MNHQPILLTLLVCTLVVCGIASPTQAQTPNDVNDLLHAWRLPEARQMLTDVEKKGAISPADLLYLKGRFAFFEGRYQKALSLYDDAIKGRQNKQWASEQALIKNTLEVTKSYKAHTSPKGYFTVYVEPRDEVLLPYAFEALDEAYEALGKELGHRPETPIRVEVYPTTQTLAKVSPLSDAEIRTSGTIALCKYNRLMITSPRALLQGYGWVDTLVHEYVHYVINHKTRNRVPIWMHEGMAKYLERRWRGEDAQRLAPISEVLLFKRLDQNKLITFEQMHPSMAKLPSQEDTAVAFAEVYTVMEYLRREVGEGAFSKVLDGINQGFDAPEAFSRALGTKNFKAFERQWRRYLKTRPRPPKLNDDDSFGQTLQFKDGKTKEDPSKEGATAELSKIKAPKAKEHAYLGQMMHARGRFKAATVQYRKATHLMKTPNPLLQTRLAQSLLEQDDAAGAYEALRDICAQHPSYLSSWIEFGRAALKLNKLDEAQAALLEAARINPFNPQVHVLLAQVFDQQGQTSRASQERGFAQRVN